MRSQKRAFLPAAVVALLLAGCTVRTSTLPLLPSATPTPSVIAASPTPTPSGGLIIPVDAPQPAAAIPPFVKVTASDVKAGSASKTAKVYFCLGPSLMAPVGTLARIRVVNAKHETVYSYTAPLPYAQAVSIVPGRYVASIADVEIVQGKPVVTMGSKSSGRLDAGNGYIYLMSGNSCPRKPSV